MSKADTRFARSRIPRARWRRENSFGTSFRGRVPRGSSILLVGGRADNVSEISGRLHLRTSSCAFSSVYFASSRHQTRATNTPADMVHEDCKDAVNPFHLLWYSALSPAFIVLWLVTSCEQGGHPSGRSLRAFRR